jgi:hypothetical protein
MIRIMQKLLEKLNTFVRYLIGLLGLAIAGYPPRWTRFEAWPDHVGFLVDKMAQGRFVPSTLVPTCTHITGCSALIIHHQVLVK